MTRAPTSQSGPRRGRRSAFSLLEVVLALAILAAAMIVCVGLVDLGVRSAREAREQSRAQEICESILGLITSGVVDVNSVQGEQQPVVNFWSLAGIASLPDELELQREEDQWLCSISTAPSDVPELLKVTVRVTENTSSATPVEFTLVRWMLDPAYIQSLEQTTTP